MKNITIILLLFLSSVIFARENGLSEKLFLDESVMITQARPQVESDQKIMPAVEMTSADKSRGKAFFMSLLLPGLGEKYVGSNPRKAQVFMATEISLWLSYTGFVTYREWRIDDYKTYAASHAGVELEGKSESYFVDLGNYSSVYEYNEAKLRERNLPEYYYDVDEKYWEWDSPTHQHNFKQLRLSADKADNRATFVIGAIFANHLISAIDAVWDVHKYNQSQKQANIDWDVKFGTMNTSQSMGLHIAAHF